MTIDEKIGLMAISSQRMGVTQPAGNGGPSGGVCNGPRSADGILCEEQTMWTVNAWADPQDPAYQFPKPVVAVYPTTESILKYGLRRMIIRDNPDPVTLTTWTNRIQEVAEGSRLGIPVVMTSNPRNHAGMDLAFGFREAAGQFSAWPGTLGLAASHDAALVREFATISAKEWNATGIRAGYMYMADLATDPRWFRIDGTFGDDPALVSSMMEAVVQGFQGGAKISPSGVLLTTKHFPGGGPRDKGWDPHYVYGKASPYPTKGSLLQYHVPPFAAAIKAGTGAIMPYYALPVNDRSVPQLKGDAKFEEVGFAYNKAIITDLLRTQLGFDGYVNSDSGIILQMPWGEKVQKMDLSARAALAINAGVDVISDMADVGVIREAYDRKLITKGRIDVAAQRLLKPMFELGLFENPYRVPEAAKEVVATPAHWNKVYEAHQKSVVLMKNAANILPLTDATLAGKKIFVEVMDGQNRSDLIVTALRKADPKVEFTRNLNEAAFALIFLSPADLTPRLKPALFDLEVHKNTQIDTERLKMIQAKVPTIVSINMEMPWLLGNVEPGARALLAGFSTKSEATLDVVRGRFRPTGKLPITLPRDIKVVEAAETNGPNNANGVTSSDVPGYLRAEKDNYAYTDQAGAKYVTGFGLSY